MVFRCLLVVSETFYDWSLHFNTRAKKEEAKFDLAIYCMFCFIIVFSLH